MTVEMVFTYFRLGLLGALGNLELLAGNDRQAEQLLLEAKLLLIKNNLQTVHEYAQILLDLGVVRTDQGRWPEAEILLKESIAALPAGSVPQAGATSHLASLYNLQGRTAEALPLINEAIAIQRQALPESRTELMYSLDALGGNWFAQRRFEQAVLYYREAWRLSQELPPGHPSRADSATHLGSALLLTGKADRAAPLLRLAESIYERLLGKDGCQLAPVLTMLARIDAQDRHPALAEEKLQRALNIVEKTYSPGHIGIAFSQVNLAEIYIDQQKYEAARPLLENALPKLRSGYPGVGSNLAAVVFQQARLEAGLREFQHADLHFRSSIAEYEKETDPHDPLLGSMLRTYAAFLKKSHRGAEAKPLEARARSIFAFQEH